MFRPSPIIINTIDRTLPYREVSSSWNPFYSNSRAILQHNNWRFVKRRWCKNSKNINFSLSLRVYVTFLVDWVHSVANSNFMWVKGLPGPYWTLSLTFCRKPLWTHWSWDIQDVLQHRISYRIIALVWWALLSLVRHVPKSQHIATLHWNENVIILNQ